MYKLLDIYGFKSPIYQDFLKYSLDIETGIETF